MCQVTLNIADTQVTQIDTSVGGTASNTDGSGLCHDLLRVQVKIIDVSITNYQNGKGCPRAFQNFPCLPMLLHQNHKAWSSAPVEFRLENILGFAQGTELVVGIVDDELRRWVDSGSNAVIVPDKNARC